MKNYVLIGFVLFGLILSAAACSGTPDDGITEYTVTFDTNGGIPASIPSITVKSGEGMGSQYPQNPSKEGFNFGGWWDGTVRYIKSTPITTDLELIGKWNKKEPQLPPEPPEPELTAREKLLKKIEDNWQELGYSEKPVKYMALTYDDGPSQYSEQLLNILAEKQVRATFFLIGSNVASWPAVVRRMRDEGHEAANHSQGYDSLGSSTLAACETSLQSCTDAIYNATNTDGNPVTPKFFRPPNLSKGTNLYTACRNKDFPIIEGTLSNDYSGGGNAGSAQNQANAIINGAREWLIALNHDPNSGTPANILAAAPLMIDGLRAKGYYLLTVSELLVMREGTLTPGKVYNDFANVP